MAGISDEAIRKATGRGRERWFAVLDKAGAKKMGHTEIARLLHDKHLGKKGSLSVATSAGWWSQMLAVEYERARGLREANQRPEGYHVGVHITLPGTAAAVRRTWDKLVAAKAFAARKLERIPSKTKRNMARYRADVGVVVAHFLEGKHGKSRLVVESTRLPKRSLIEPMRAYWKKMLAERFGGL